MQPRNPTDDHVARRAVLRAAAVGGATVALAGCGGDGNPPAAAPPRSGPMSTDAPGPRSTPAPRADPSTAGPTGSDPPAGLGPASEVEVGSGIIYSAASVVVTQPRRGEFKAFSTTCTHQGCPVGNISGGEIECPCHGSRYSVHDGSVVQGPATEPLAEKRVRVEDGRVVVG